MERFYACSDDSEKVIDGLRPNGVVKIYVGRSDTPYLMRRDLLELHTDHFRDQLQGDSEHTLRFPDDDEGSWEVVLYWLVRQKLPHFIYWDCSLCDELQVRVYAIAEKHGLKQLQDEIMITTIYNLDGAADWEWKNWDLADRISLVCEITESDSKLRDLLVEEAIQFIKYTGNLFGVQFASHQLQDLEGTGFFLAFTAKYEEYQAMPDGSLGDRRGWQSIPRVSQSSKDTPYYWKNYMVGQKSDYEEAGKRLGLP